MYSQNNIPLITIIIPVYKAEKLIAGCIESVIKQTVNYWNLILVNDGSPDNSGEICENFARKDNRIIVIHQDNGGPGKARNAGIDACKTKWFTFVDADDQLDSHYLANFHVYDCKKDTVLSCQGFTRVDLQGNSLGEKFDFADDVYRGHGFVERAFFENNLYNFGQSVGKLYNINICKTYQLRLNTEIKWSEDHLFYLQYLMYVEEIHTHSGCLYFYQLDDGQETLTHRSLPYKEALKIFNYIYSAANAIVNKYALNDPIVMNRINYHSVTAGFSLVIQNLYREEENKKMRIDVIQALKTKMKVLRNKYNPRTISGEIIKYLLLYVPSSLLDLILFKIIRK